MAKGKNQHVVKHSDGWAVKGAGRDRTLLMKFEQADRL